MQLDVDRVFFQNEDTLIEYRADADDQIGVYRNGNYVRFFYKNDIRDMIDLVLTLLKVEDEPFSIPSVRKFLDGLCYSEVVADDSKASVIFIELYDSLNDDVLGTRFEILS